MRPVKEQKPKDLIPLRVKAIRMRARLSQEEFAERLDVTDKTIRRIEKGETPLSVNAALKIKEEFGNSLEYILGISEHENKKTPCSDCSELSKAESLIEMQETEIKKLKRKLDIIKSILEDKPRKIKLNIKTDRS